MARALTLVAKINGDIFFEIESVHDGPDEVGNHPGAFNLDSQVVVTCLKVVDFCVSPDNV